MKTPKIKLIRLENAICVNENIPRGVSGTDSDFFPSYYNNLKLVINPDVLKDTAQIRTNNCRDLVSKRNGSTGARNPSNEN